MKHKHLLLFSGLLLALMFARVCSVLAKAPATAKIAFSANREENRDIYLMNPDGSEQVNLTKHRADDIAPVWSPTGEQILFASDRGHRAWGAWDLYLMDASGENVQKVFETSVVRTSPTWSPDGTQIAYKRLEHDEWLIYIATSDGKNEERMAIGSGPAWSPDGTEIAFIGGALKRNQIGMLNLHTRKQKFFFPKEARASWLASPVWSPAGDKLAFSWLNRVPLVDFVETETIYLVNRDGTGLTQIVDEAGPRATNPVWSPHGDALLYTQHDGKGRWSSQIFKIALDRGQREQLTDIGIWNSPSDWFDPAFALPVSPQPQLLTTVWGQMKQQ